MTAYQIPNRAFPGSLLKKPLPEKRKPLQLGRSPRKEDADYLDMIRKLPCLKCGDDPCGEAAHIRMASATHGKRPTGMGEKPDDKWTLPLCGGCHRLDKDALHKVGELPFFHALNLNPLLVCEQLQKVDRSPEAMRSVIFQFVAKR